MKGITNYFFFALLARGHPVSEPGDGPPRFTSLPARRKYFAEYRASINGRFTEPIQLSCAVRGKKRFKFFWLKDGNNITAGDSRFNINSGTNKTTLRINSSDGIGGKYQCMVKNDKGIIIASPTTLTRVGPVRKDHESVKRSISLGSTMKEMCPHVPSTTPVQLEWYHQGSDRKAGNPVKPSWRKLVTRDGTFMISQIREEDHARYLCQAGNINKEFVTISSFRLNVKKRENPAPATPLSLMYHSPRHTYASLGEEAAIYILFAYNIEPPSDLDIKWEKDGNELLQYKDKSQITFTATRKANGKYKATATAPDKATLSYTVELHVIERPRIDKGPENYAERYSKTVHTFCNATGSPIPDVTITIKASDGTLIKTETHKGSVSLALDPTVRPMAHITCIAANEEGWEKANGTMTIMKSSDPAKGTKDRAEIIKHLGHRSSVSSICDRGLFIVSFLSMLTLFL